MTRVLAVSAQGPLSPSFRVRVGIPASELRRYGVELELCPLFDLAQERRFRSAGAPRKLAAVTAGRRRLRARLRSLREDDSVLIQRQVDLLPGRSLERLALRGRWAVLDVDDAIWLDGSAEAGGHALARLKRTAPKLRWLVPRVDRVIAGNELLADWLSAGSDAVTVVPSVIDERTVLVRTHQETDTVVLGWIGSASTSRYLEAVRPVVRRVAQQLRPLHVELRLIGAGAMHIDGVDVVAEPWSLDSERDLLRRMDVGLMPQPDSPWTRGKCAYKAIQYMAAGVPVVADAVGVSASVIGDQRAGLIVHSPGEWVDALVTLAQDVALRRRLGAAGRARVESDYSVRRWAPVVSDLLQP